MKRRNVLGAMLAVSLTAVLAGCSSSTGGSGSAVGGTDAGGAGQTSTEAAAVAGDYTYVIGHYGGITGSVAIAGENGYNGIKLAVKQWNDKGGVLGGPIKLEFYDDGATTEGAVKGVSYLIDDCKVDGIIGSQLSGNIQATGDLIEASKIPEVATGMNPAWLEKGWTYLFRSLPNSSGGAAPLVDAMENLGTTRLGCLVYQDDGNISAYTQVKAVIEERKTVEIVDDEQAMVGETDWTGALSSIVDKKPDGVLIFAQGEQGCLMVKQLRSLGYTGYIYGPETFSMPDIRKVAGDGANGVVFFTPHCIPDQADEANSEMEKAFLEAYEEEYGELPTHDVAYRAYDAANILLTAVEKAGTRDGEAVRSAIKGLQMDILAGHADFTMFDNGECMSGQKIFITHEGKNITLEKFLESNPADTYQP